MKKFYCVTNSYDDKGKVRVFIEESEQETKPKDSFKETKKCDVYYNWFETVKKAEAFRKECYKA